MNCPASPPARWAAASGWAASAGETSKIGPNTSFSATKAAAMPQLVRRNCRRSIPSLRALASERSLSRSSNCRWRRVCGKGLNSPFDTIRVGTGDLKSSPSAGSVCASSRLLRKIPMAFPPSAMRGRRIGEHPCPVWTIFVFGGGGRQDEWLTLSVVIARRDACLFRLSSRVRQIGLFDGPGALLFGHKPLDNPPHLHARCIRGDIDEAVFAELVEPCLLRLDHDTVFDKGRGNLLIELLGRLGFVLAIAVRHRPEIKAAGLRLRGEAVEQAELEPAIALAFIGARASIGGAGPLQHAAWGDELKLLPAVYSARETCCLDVGRRR